MIYPQQYSLSDDGTFPNSRLPLLVYRQPLGTPLDLANVLDKRFAEFEWTNSWQNGVYDYAHYHSTTHEVLGVYDGAALLQIGGPTLGADVKVMKGDVIVIPAGVAHKQLECSSDFGVVGAYPDGRKWDVLRGVPTELPAADDRIAALPLPAKDPLYGIDGPLVTLWGSLDVQQKSH